MSDDDATGPLCRKHWSTCDACPECEQERGRAEAKKDYDALLAKYEAILPLALFGAWCVEEARGDEIGDIDGGSLQDELERAGLLGNVTVTEPCGEHCRCAEYDRFPQECLRETDTMKAALAALKGGGE